MRQDKFVELRIAQLHWNAVPRLAFGHLGPKASRFQRIRPISLKGRPAKAFRQIHVPGKPATSCWIWPKPCSCDQTSSWWRRLDHGCVGGTTCTQIRRDRSDSRVNIGTPRLFPVRRRR
jgi:hypothetical protein